MFELESKSPETITIKTSTKQITINFVESTIMADLGVGVISGPGEYEIGEVAILGVPVMNNTKTIYDVSVSGVRIGILGDIEEGLDDIGVSDILCTSSVRAIREIGPKLIVATGNVDGMVAELKLSARTEKKLKIKRVEDLPTTQEVVVLN
ncbi:MAG: hypothetical protein NNC33_01690 [Candidatus Nanosyncoccus sp. P13S_S20_bin.18.1]|nr:hypothetical protein [Candidatus Nanosyncoccus sp. P13S_S20_bin.18.1]